MNDSFADLIEALLQPDAKTLGFRFGTVLSADPLTVEVAGLTAENVWCNAAFLEEPREVEAELTGGVTSEGGSITGGKLTGTLTVKEPLKAGDRVVLLSNDDQVFYIICKVVSTGDE